MVRHQACFYIQRKNGVTREGRSMAGFEVVSLGLETCYSEAVRMEEFAHHVASFAAFPIDGVVHATHIGV